VLLFFTLALPARRLAVRQSQLRFRDFGTSLFHGGNLLSRGYAPIAAGDDCAGRGPAAYPGGAVCPAMKPTTVLSYASDKLRAVSSAFATDFPDHDNGSVCGRD